MKLEEIYQPISKELLEVQDEIKKIVNDLTEECKQGVFNHFFKIPGKYLRPALALLSAKASKKQFSENEQYQLIKLATALELIHSASLVHDDIIDGDLMRRGQETINNTHGNKIAVLAGDILHTRAFSIFVECLPSDFPKIMIGIVERMCTSEIEQAGYGENIPQKQRYLEMIKGKTALLMSTSCRLGAQLISKDYNFIAAMENFGLNFGMMYQMVDDLIDNDSVANRHVSVEDVQEYASQAKTSINNIGDSIYKRKLNDLTDSILSIINVKTTMYIK